MLVDVVLMRADGARLTAEERAAAMPVRGELRIKTGPVRRYLSVEPWPTTRLVTLTRPGEDVSLLRPLVHAWIRDMEGDQFLIVGEEFVNTAHTMTGNPQAWWCTVVRES